MKQHKMIVPTKASILPLSESQENQKAFDFHVTPERFNSGHVKSSKSLSVGSGKQSPIAVPPLVYPVFLTTERGTPTMALVPSLDRPTEAPKKCNDPVDGMAGIGMVSLRKMG